MTWNISTIPGRFSGSWPPDCGRGARTAPGPVTVLSCDNLQHNGDTARKAFTSFIEAQDPGLAQWVKKNVTFPNSMVDRITPAVTPDDVKRLDAQSGVEDAAPVYSEDFIQWVIEDDFIAGRPDWERGRGVYGRCFRL